MAGPTGRAVNTERFVRDRAVESTSLIGLTRAYLDRQYDALVRHGLDLRHDLELGPDAVHLARVTVRRYRSALRGVPVVFVADQAAALDAELSWYGARLGAVRDLQVLRTHVTATLDALAPELLVGPVRSRVERALSSELRQAEDELADALGSQRYLRLRQELRRWSEAPPVTGKDRPARAVRSHLDRAVRRARNRLVRAQRLEAADPTRDAAFHRARTAAKRARYLAELSEPELGPAARAAAKRWKQQQDRLGQLTDGVVAAEFFRRLGQRPGTNGFTFGVLWAHERLRGDRWRTD